MADKRLESKPEPKLRDAAARTAEVLQTLQSRLRKETLIPSPEDGPEDLGGQLQEYFAASAKEPPTGVPSDIRELVIERVADRVLRSWNDPASGLADVKNEVVTRLVERVLVELRDKRR